MSTTPTEADKWAAKQILGFYAESEPEAMARTERIIAEAMRPEREALRLAKEAMKVIDAHCPTPEALDGIDDDKLSGNRRTPITPKIKDIQQMQKALAAIEKVEG